VEEPPRRDQRDLVAVQTGCPWRDVPERYGPWQTVYSRFRSWELDGTWERLFTAILAEAEAAGAIEWIASVDSTVARAHQHAAGAQKGAEPSSRQVPPTAQAAGHPEPDNHGLGRSRGGLRTKTHLVAAARCRPLGFVVTEGQACDIAHARAALEAVAVPTPRWPARTRPGILLGDKAYSSRAFRNYLRRRKIRHVIPEPDNQKANRINRGSAGGRPTGFDRPTYKIRNTVERCFSKLKQFRGFAT